MRKTFRPTLEKPTSLHQMQLLNAAIVSVDFLPKFLQYSNLLSPPFPPPYNSSSSSDWRMAAVKHTFTSILHIFIDLCNLTER